MVVVVERDGKVQQTESGESEIGISGSRGVGGVGEGSTPVEEDGGSEGTFREAAVVGEGERGYLEAVWRERERKDSSGGTWIL